MAATPEAAAETMAACTAVGAEGTCSTAGAAATSQLGPDLVAESTKQHLNSDHADTGVAAKAFGEDPLTPLARKSAVLAAQVPAEQQVVGLVGGHAPRPGAAAAGACTLASDVLSELRQQHSSHQQGDRLAADWIGDRCITACTSASSAPWGSREMGTLAGYTSKGVSVQKMEEMEELLQQVKPGEQAVSV